MSSSKVEIFIAMAVYLLVIVVIGLVTAKRAGENSETFFLGGRGLGPWVAAMSAEASDMSGWLLMGLPGVAFWLGAADAAWTAIGLFLGTYINWLVVAKPLRRYSALAGNSITLPDFFSNRFKEAKAKPLLIISSLFILVFFAVYTGSCFATAGKLFAQLFGAPYLPMMILGAIIVIFYTLLGGFLAESISDFVQGIVMIIALIAVLIGGIAYAGGFGAVAENIKNIPGFTSFFGMASPTTVIDPVTGLDTGVQLIENGVAQFGGAAKYGLLTIISTMSWGLGYFGMPQVLLRFFAIRKLGEIKSARRIASVWCFISLSAAVIIGLVGRAVSVTNMAGAGFTEAGGADLFTSAGAEGIFVVLSKMLFHPLVAGIMMAGILAAVMSSSDSYLLIASSALAKDLYQGVFKKNADDKQVMLISRLALLLVAVFGVLVALDQNSKIFTIVSFAWAGFGATFGPLVLFSLFWKRVSHAGAVAGVVAGGAMVFIWKFALRPLGGVLGIYELLPAFLFSCVAIVVVSLLTKEPSRAIQEEFVKAKTYEV
ncbi:MAG: sodium/proline symporter PutP [Oscillospiraceae bacterium]|jgi:sodium/proline symporter|nr:sodium/proline symporter PutP [Oscillospiraceae bacterium]